MLNIKDSTRVFLCPTDTIYGLSARASDAEAIERIRELKGRGESQNFITLIAGTQDLEKFDVKLTVHQEKLLTRIWPGPVTVVLDTLDGSTKAFRVPDYPELIEFIKKVGPIVSTSANMHGQAPVYTITEAKEVFGNKIDEYINAGELAGEPSTIIKILR